LRVRDEHDLAEHVAAMGTSIGAASMIAVSRANVCGVGTPSNARAVTPSGTATPLGCAIVPPSRSAAMQRSRSGPPASARSASTPPGATRRATTSTSSCWVSTASSAPRRRNSSRPSPPLAVAITRAPRRFASCTAIVPTPAVAPCTSSVWPARTPSASSIPASAVRPVTGIAPASRKSSDVGIGATCSALSTTYSA
jgi:hypothetical protein